MGDTRIDDIGVHLEGRYRWATLPPGHFVACIRVLSCLSDVPQSREDIAEDLRFAVHEVGDTIRMLRGYGWRIHGSYVAGYTLVTSAVQREWLRTQHDALAQ